MVLGVPKSWDEINREIREARDMLAELEKLAIRAGREGDRIMYLLLKGRISYEEAKRRLERLVKERGRGRDQD